MNYNSKRIKQRFWEKVDKKGPNDCWEWLGGKSAGYGKAWDGSRVVCAHRLSWEWANKKKIHTAIIMHTCDNRGCVNPSHLQKGTPLKNSQDMCIKDRQARGETHSQVKLTEKQIIQIRKMYRTKTYSCIELGKIFKVNNGQISRIIRGKQWKHVKGSRSQINRKATCGENSGASKLTTKQVLQIRKEYEEKKEAQVLTKHIAAKYNISLSTVYAIIHKKTWKYI
jgi:hypothetical protein